jgi:hypothetical protein
MKKLPLPVLQCFALVKQRALLRPAGRRHRIPNPDTEMHSGRSQVYTRAITNLLAEFLLLPAGQSFAAGFHPSNGYWSSEPGRLPLFGGCSVQPVVSTPQAALAGQCATVVQPKRISLCNPLPQLVYFQKKFWGERRDLNPGPRFHSREIA